MPRLGDVHVVSGDKGWRVEIEGFSGPPRSTHNTQAEAVRVGREVAQHNHSELLVHGRNGKVRMRNSYGNDPRRSPG